MTTRQFFTAASLSAAPLLFLRGSSASAQVSEVLQTPRSEAEQIAIDAYVYGYSLITTEVTRVQMSNVDKTRRHARAHRGSSPISSAIHRPTSVACRRRMPTRFIRWPGSI